MKIFRSVVYLAGLAVASCHDHTARSGASFGVLMAQESAAKVTGTWKLALDTPHGQMPGALQLKQEGAKLSGSVDVEHMGSMPLAGQMEGKKISFSIEIQGNQKITFTGTVTAEKMSGTMEQGGSWSATRSPAQI